MYSVGFLRFLDLNTYTLFKPITNTLFIFFPRFYFNESKPYPDSYNGDISGMGMYVCVSEIAGENFMSEYYPSTHYFWQFSFFGILILPIISSIYIFLISVFARNMHFILKLLFILLAIRPFSFSPQLIISDIIVMIVSKIIPFLIFYYFFIKLFHLKNYLNKKFL